MALRPYQRKGWVVIELLVTPNLSGGTTKKKHQHRQLPFEGVHSWTTPPMAYKMKGIFKGLKVISHIFVLKEHEMEIGCPTDVKHVAHIGWDGPTGNASPSWMNDIRASSDFSSLGNFAPSAGTSWASQDFDQPRDASPFGIVSEHTGQDAAAPCADIPRPPRKTRRRRKKPTDGSPVPSSRSSRPEDSLASAAAAPAAVAVGANSMQ